MAAWGIGGAAGYETGAGAGYGYDTGIAGIVGPTMTWGVVTAGLLVTGEPQGIPDEHATLHEGGIQGTGHPTGLQPENPGGNVTPAEYKEKF